MKEKPNPFDTLNNDKKHNVFSRKLYFKMYFKNVFQENILLNISNFCEVEFPTNGKFNDAYSTETLKSKISKCSSYAQ